MEQRRAVVEDKQPPAIKLELELRDHGEVCPNRGIPLVDVYLSGSGGKSSIAQGCWMYRAGVSVPFAECIAGWFAERGVEVRRQEMSSEPDRSRDLFADVV